MLPAAVPQKDPQCDIVRRLSVVQQRGGLNYHSINDNNPFVKVFSKISLTHVFVNLFKLTQSKAFEMFTKNHLLPSGIILSNL